MSKKNRYLLQRMAVEIIIAHHPISNTRFENIMKKIILPV